MTNVTKCGWPFVVDEIYEGKAVRFHVIQAGLDFPGTLHHDHCSGIEKKKIVNDPNKMKRPHLKYLLNS